jgi:uncharacterized protein (TIGR00252 family)
MVGGINDFFLLSIINRANCRAKKNGLKLVEQNYLTKFGEIDIIMLDKLEQTLVFVEVRYRENMHFGSAISTINNAKQEKIIYAANHFLNSFFQQVLAHFFLNIEVLIFPPYCPLQC